MMNPLQTQLKSNPNNLQNLEGSKEKQKIKGNLRVKKEEKGEGEVKAEKDGGQETEAGGTGPEVETEGGQSRERGDDPDQEINGGRILRDGIIIPGAETDGREALKGQEEIVQGEGMAEERKGLKGSLVHGRRLKLIQLHQDQCLIKEIDLIAMWSKFQDRVHLFKVRQRGF